MELKTFKRAKEISKKIEELEAKIKDIERIGNEKLNFTIRFYSNKSATSEYNSGSSFKNINSISIKSMILTDLINQLIELKAEFSRL